MAVNRLSLNKKSRGARLSEAERPGGSGNSSAYPHFSMERESLEHEAVEVSLCDEGMCFFSEVRHTIGTVLQVDFEPQLAGGAPNEFSLRSEGVVVDCQPSPGGLGFEITVLFTGN